MLDFVRLCLFKEWIEANCGRKKMDFRDSNSLLGVVHTYLEVILHYVIMFNYSGERYNVTT